MKRPRRYDEGEGTDEEIVMFDQMKQRKKSKKEFNQVQNSEAAATTDDNDPLLLPTDYVPGPDTVICARGKKYWDHSGNQRYRQIIASATSKYSQTTNKYDRTLIVSEIVRTLQRGQCNKDRGCSPSHTTTTSIPRSAFIKLDPSTKRWKYVVDEIFIREKVSQSLRDSLAGKYKSSTKSKKLRKTIMFETTHTSIENVIHSNPQISQRISQLSTDIQTYFQYSANDDDQNNNNQNSNVQNKNSFDGSCAAQANTSPASPSMIMNSYPSFSQKLSPPTALTRTTSAISIDDKSLLSLFNQANLDILETIKQDDTLRTKFQDASNKASEKTTREAAYVVNDDHQTTKQPS